MQMQFRTDRAEPPEPGGEIVFRGGRASRDELECRHMMRRLAIVQAIEKLAIATRDRRRDRRHAIGAQGGNPRKLG